MPVLLERLVVEHNPSAIPIDAAVIWLHGLGADGYDFEPVVPQLDLPESFAVRFIFPHAPVRAVTINMGYEMRSWYDILSMEEVRKINEAQLEESCSQLRELIAEQRSQGIKTERIVIAGFSQGGAVALSTVPAYEQPLAGIVALSTYLPLADQLADRRTPANANVPIFMGHGTQDPVVLHSLGEATRNQLQTWGYPVEWHEYEMPHAVCMEEITDISNWLQRVLLTRR